ncbi:BZ3500_MvSof-1268-A1-R1_Chr1-3g01705 [Microbotryum saponariae]|uniref:BZ3500_MvSof-1268-A1-R1_Chr1-3g01705 protein n=1 Tax=Microbotryum saponariae TaxID=289078 RepID=A0A2X0L313_9BASI|nr:BZ3500_MvSof-1268-A1-R1_Chr1-3g01705 [Microbotryum saponariae]SCZ94377.1 BZ3501_MvSof-1269-A2-R1_Chr1-3g01306 [Microbotryum saponariae]
MIRHGESADNVTAIWAGHRDAPLTNHGFNQSMRLANHFQDVPLTGAFQEWRVEARSANLLKALTSLPLTPTTVAVYCSDLKRAQTTARNITSLNKTQPPPPFTVSPLLREQFFGEAEGWPWNAGLYSSSHLPWEDHRAFRLAPYAESLNDVSLRADKVVRHFVLPHLIASSESSTPQHILLVAHGIWLSEMRYAFARAQDPQVRFVKSGGYLNTAWSRFELGLVREGEVVDRVQNELPEPEESGGSTGEEEEVVVVEETALSSSSATNARPTNGRESDLSSSTVPESIRLLLPTIPDLPPRNPALPRPYPNDVPLPRIRFKVLATNQAEHLEGLVRTKGGIGSSAHDENQRGLQEFFGGGGK